MYSVTVYEATNPDGPSFTARMEGRACAGVGKTISDALHHLADELIGQSHVAGEAAINFVSDFRMPSCTTCGEITKSVCPKCSSGSLNIPIFVHLLNWATKREKENRFRSKDILRDETEQAACSWKAEAYGRVVGKLRGIMGIAENEVIPNDETGVVLNHAEVDKKPTSNDRQVGGSHYRSDIQHWDYVLANGIPYLEAQVIKYLTRWRKKNGLEDVMKAQHYLDKLIEVETENRK